MEFKWRITKLRTQNFFLKIFQCYYMVFKKIFDHNNLVYFLLLFIVWCSQYETLCVVSAIYGPSSSALCGGVIEYILHDRQVQN